MNKAIAIVVSEFNQEIIHPLLQGAQQHLIESGMDKEHITTVFVPGAVEIPLTAQLLAKNKRFDAIICLGAVIRGETSHYDYVCQQVSAGCQKVMLDFDIPVIFGILTTENEEQALDRIGGKHGHKGKEAAQAALAMIEVVKKITSSL